MKTKKVMKVLKGTDSMDYRSADNAEDRTESGRPQVSEQRPATIQIFRQWRQKRKRKKMTKPVVGIGR